MARGPDRRVLIIIFVKGPPAKSGGIKIDNNRIEF